MKMLGRLGWRGQCSCCNGPKDQKSIRAEEKRDWKREIQLEKARVSPIVRAHMANVVVGGTAIRSSP